jgi:hypothetical protein
MFSKVKTFILALFIRFIYNLKVYKFFVRRVLPKLRFTNNYTRLDGLEFKEMYRLMQEGDIVFSIDRKKGSAAIIGGEWSHAAICIAKNESGIEIAEMVGTGYREVTFFDFCKEADEVAVKRCIDWDPDYIKVVIEEARSHNKAPYDVQFLFENYAGKGSGKVEALYCSEHVYISDVKRILDVDLTDLMGIGHMYLSPTGLYNAKNCVLVMRSKSFK